MLVSIQTGLLEIYVKYVSKIPTVTMKKKNLIYTKEMRMESKQFTTKKQTKKKPTTTTQLNTKEGSRGGNETEKHV